MAGQSGVRFEESTAQKIYEEHDMWRENKYNFEAENRNFGKIEKYKFFGSKYENFRQKCEDFSSKIRKSTAWKVKNTHSVEGTNNFYTKKKMFKIFLKGFSLYVGRVWLMGYTILGHIRPKVKW